MPPEPRRGALELRNAALVVLALLALGISSGWAQSVSSASPTAATALGGVSVTVDGPCAPRAHAWEPTGATLR